MNEDLKFVRKFPDKCATEVSRDGESQPCDKVAVAVTRGRDEWDDEGMWWPVCAHHTRKAHAVPLVDLIKALES